MERDDDEDQITQNPLAACLACWGVRPSLEMKCVVLSPAGIFVIRSSTTMLNPSIFNTPLYRSVLNLWFQDVPYPASTVSPSVLARWYGYSPEAKAFDAQCSSTAREALLSIAPSRYTLPKSTESDSSVTSRIAEPFLAQLSSSGSDEASLAPEQIGLALIILLDQCSRNCFRDSQKDIYTHYDRIARWVLRALMARELDTHDRYRDFPAWRMWFYMPLTHSESLHDHEKFGEKLVEMRKSMEAKGDGDAVAYVDIVLGFEKRHRVIIEKFGRYPHRNIMMERESTNEERDYLQNGGETFGTSG